MQGTSEQPGIIYRAVERIIQRMNQKDEGTNTSSLSISYLEIYNEKVFDLIQPKEQDLHIREDQNK